jgi:hypothetical protein
MSPQTFSEATTLTTRGAAVGGDAARELLPHADSASVPASARSASVRLGTI